MGSGVDYNRPRPSRINFVYMSDDLKAYLKALKDLVQSVSESNEVSPEYYIDVNTELTQYLISLSETKAEMLREFLLAEAERKKNFFKIKRDYINGGMKIGESEAQAEMDIFDLRVKESNAHADYQYVKGVLEAVDSCITVNAQRIKLLTQEMRLSS